MKNRTGRIAFAVVATLLLAMLAYAQRRGPRGAGEESLAQPFRGIAAGGKIEEGLFKIRSTGVSTQPVVAAAKSFLADPT